MSLNFFLKASNVSTDTVINMRQNIVLNLPLPTNSSDFISKKYLDEKLAIAANADQIIVDSGSSEKETVQQALETLDNKVKGYLPKSEGGGTMNAP